jgi:glycosyltransferase involved in cell wall biosynthesis
MKLLIGGSSTFMFHLQEFAKKLNELGVETKLVYDADYADRFPSRKILTWFNNKKKFERLVDEFKPDAIFIDRQKHFGIASIEKNIPLMVLLRGHYWSELEWYKKTIYKKFPKNIIIKKWDDIAQRIFQEAEMILPICKYLEDVTNEFVPNKKTDVFFEGIDASRWYQTEGMKLKHPCVGLVQRANWWGKTSEMLVLKKVLEKMPNVHFYWAGDGPFRHKIMDELGNYKNFHWLGKLEYPNKVREFLTEIDVYALITGMDLAPLSLKEAQLMEKPVIATNVGGNPEMMIEGKTGFLVEKGSYDDIIKKISLLLEDKKMSLDMGIAGRKFIEETYNWDVVTKKFIHIFESNMKKTH